MKGIIQATENGSINSESEFSDRFSDVFSKLYLKLIHMEKIKALPPKFSVSCNELAEFFKVQNNFSQLNIKVRQYS